MVAMAIQVKSGYSRFAPFERRNWHGACIHLQVAIGKMTAGPALIVSLGLPRMEDTP